MRKDDVPVVYDMSDDPKSPDATLMSPLPTIADEDRVYVVVADWKRSRAPWSFALSAEGTIVQVPNEPIVRTPGEVELMAHEFQTQRVEIPQRPRCKDQVIVSENAYYEHIAPLPSPARGGEQFAIKLTASLPAGAAGPDPKIVTLVDKKLPPAHPRYEFSVATGLAYAFRNDREFSKVKIVEDDPTTTNINESRYRIASTRQRDGLAPIMAINLYLGRRQDPKVPRDPTDGSLKGRPGLVLGIDIKDPSRNFFGGLSVEPVENLELVGGVVVGKVHALKARNDVTEDRDASAPATYATWVGKPFLGITFNLNFLTNYLPKF